MPKKYMNQTEYAKHRGITRQAIIKYKKQGILKVKSDGNPWIIDVEESDKSISENIAADHHADGRPPGVKKEPVENEKPVSEIELTIIEAGLDAEDLTFNEARTFHEKYKAALAKIKYEERCKQLIPAEKIEAEWIKICVSIRTKVLGIKSSITPLVNEYFDDEESRYNILNAVDRVICDALNEIAVDK